MGPGGRVDQPCEHWKFGLPTMVKKGISVASPILQI